MALPQTQVNYQLAPGVPGEVAYDAPVNAQVRRLNSSGQAQIIGYAYTESGQTYDGEGGSENNITAQVGGTGMFAGILIQPKAYSSTGGSGGPTTDTYQLPDNSIGELLRNGSVFVSLGNAANIGDDVLFNQTTGAITSQSQNASFTGAIAVTTGVLTVSAMAAGSPLIGIGSALTGTGVAAGTIITGFLTGTNGGVGTYSTNVTAAVSSTATLTTRAAVASGYARIPNARIDYYNLSAAGIAVVKITGAPQ